MRVKISYLKIIMIMIACTALYFMICPWYVKGVAGIYTRNFADVLNSHNTKSYDRFFSKDTIFELNGKQITYADAKENMEKMQAFTSRFSYGHLEEWTNRKEFFAVAISKEYSVCLRLPIVAEQSPTRYSICPPLQDIPQSGC